jgi:hypothetical protein
MRIYRMRISYGRVQGSRYNACTRKYGIICPGGKKKKAGLWIQIQRFCGSGSILEIRIPDLTIEGKLSVNMYRVKCTGKM